MDRDIRSRLLVSKGLEGDSLDGHGDKDKVMRKKKAKEKRKEKKREEKKDKRILYKELRLLTDNWGKVRKKRERERERGR